MKFTEQTLRQKLYNRVPWNRIFFAFPIDRVFSIDVQSSFRVLRTAILRELHFFHKIYFHFRESLCHGLTESDYIVTPVSGINNSISLKFITTSDELFLLKFYTLYLCILSQHGNEWSLVVTD